MNNKKGGLSMRIWITILIFMLMGSIANGVESMFLGLYLNNTVFKHGSMGAPLTLTDTINLISSLSAVVMGVTTFVVGTISEKMKLSRNCPINVEIYVRIIYAALPSGLFLNPFPIR